MNNKQLAEALRAIDMSTLSIKGIAAILNAAEVLEFEEVQPVADEREAFEKKFGMPLHCIRCGDGYATTSYNAWDAQKHVARFEGWKARAARAAAASKGNSK